MKKKKFKEQKYKNLLQIREIPYQNNLRILKFKRPKWNFLKKNIQRKANKIFFFRKYQKFNKRFYFFNQKGYQINNRWTNIRFRYKELLLAKRKLFLFFSLKSKLKDLKKIMQNNTSTSFLTKLETRLDILLWRTGIFSSPAVARFALNHKHVKLNNKSINLNSIFLKKGDLITFSKNIKNELNNNLSKFKTIKIYNKKFIIFQENINQFFPYYIEINWDMLEIMYISTTNKLIINSMTHMYPKNLNISKFKNYLRLL